VEQGVAVMGTAIKAEQTELQILAVVVVVRMVQELNQAVLASLFLN
jgi:hypothetical protein